jgi:hypothetical protein
MKIAIDYLMCTCGQLYYVNGGQANGSLMKPRITYIYEDGQCVETINRPIISHGIMCKEGLLKFMDSIEDYKTMIRTHEKFSELEKKCKK